MSFSITSVFNSLVLLYYTPLEQFEIYTVLGYFFTNANLYLFLPLLFIVFILYLSVEEGRAVNKMHTLTRGTFNNSFKGQRCAFSTLSGNPETDKTQVSLNWEALKSIRITVSMFVIWLLFAWYQSIHINLQFVMNNSTVSQYLLSILDQQTCGYVLVIVPGLLSLFFQFLSVRFPQCRKIFWVFIALPLFAGFFSISSLCLQINIFTGITSGGRLTNILCVSLLGTVYYNLGADVFIY